MPVSTAKILTRHPDPEKKGANISKSKYDIIREGIIEVLGRKQLTATEIFNMLKLDLDGSFDGSITWYGETVKLDLEARKLIERIPGTQPQLYRLLKK